MELKKLLTKLGRLILLFVIIIGSFFQIGIAGVVLKAYIPIFRSIGWRLRHGNKVAFDGHTFHLPFLWNCTPDDHLKSLELSEDHQLLPGLSSIDLSSTGRVLDSAAARRWQAEHIASSNRTVPNLTASEIIHGKRLEFVCTRQDIDGVLETLFCNVSNTDLSVIVITSGKYRSQARAVLETSD